MALPFDYELWTVDGFILEKGRKIDQSSIVLNHHGMHILKMFDGQDVFTILVKRL